MTAQPQSQKQRLLALLADHDWHTTLDIMARVYCVEGERGIARVGARIWDLKHDGNEIEARHETSKVWSYRLKPIAIPAPAPREPIAAGQISFLRARGY